MREEEVPGKKTCASTCGQTDGTSIIGKRFKGLKVNEKKRKKKRQKKRRREEGKNIKESDQNPKRISVKREDWVRKSKRKDRN